METKGEEKEIKEAAEVLDSAPMTEVEKEAESYEIPANYTPLTDIEASKRVDKFLSELLKFKDLSIRYRAHDKWPSLIPEMGGKSVAYLYPGKSSVRIETAHIEEVEGKAKTFRHTWSYQIKADGIYKAKDKVSMKAVVGEVKAFAKAKGYL